MLQFQLGQTLMGVASVANKLTISISGSRSSVAAGATPGWSGLLYQGQLSSSPTALVWPVLNTTVNVTDMQVVNTDAAAHTFQLFLGGSTTANQIVPPMTVEAGCMAIYGQNGWQFFDATGSVKSATSGGGGAPSGTAGGELAGTYPNPTVAATHGGSAHHAAFVQADHDLLANPHHVSFTSTDHAALANPHHVSFVAADHAALANPHHVAYVAADHTAVGTASPHHVAFVQADHDALANPHHAVLNLAAVAPPKDTPGAASAIGSGTNAARDNHSHQESGGVASRIVATSAFNTTETQLVGFTIPANLLAVGSTFRLTANGICTSTVANAATFRCRIGTTTLTGNIACSIAPVGTTTASSAPFMVDIVATVRAIGASGSIIGNGTVLANSAAGALQAFTGFQALSATVATVAVDTTANKIIELTAVTAATTTTLTVHTAVLDWCVV